MEPFERLEIEWASFNNLDPRGMVCCASGTSALHLSLEAMQLPADSKVILGDFNMIACPRAVTMAGLEPVFVDCDDRLLMDAELKFDCGIVKMPAPNDIKCIMAVHVYGRRVDMDSWMSSPISAKVVEDLAEAHGVKPHPQTDAACWSFFSNKIIAGAEGGAVWFKDLEHAELARSLRCLGFDSRHDFNHRPRGWNHRMSNCHAELILKSLKNYQGGPWTLPDGHRVASLPEHRRTIEGWYEDHCPVEWRMPKRDAVWVYDIRIPGLTPVKQDEIVYGLNKAGIAARHAFKPMCGQEEYVNCKMIAGDNIQGTKSRLASKEVLYLPVQPGTTTEETVKKSFQMIQACLG